MKEYVIVVDVGDYTVITFPGFYHHQFSLFFSILMALAFKADHEVCWVKVFLKMEVVVSGNDHHGG
jgi:hypothetical protein